MSSLNQNFVTNTTNPNLNQYGQPLGPHGINTQVPGGYGTTGNPIMGQAVNVTAKRTVKDKWKNALNQGKTMLKDAWSNMKENQVIKPEERKTTDMTNFKMGIVSKALAGPGNQANQQNFSMKKSPLNPKNGLLGQGYGGAGGYKV